jgi:hypothetical protein
VCILGSATPIADDQQAMIDTARSVGVWTAKTALRPPAAVLATCSRAAERAVASAADSVADRLLAEGLAERFIERLLEAPEVEHLLSVMLDSPGMERLVNRAIESHLTESVMARLIDDAARQLPQSKALWALIDQVAQSPAVTDAITQQGLGLADEVAADLRDRSRDADAWLERAARRVTRRRGGRTTGGMPQPQTS